MKKTQTSALFAPLVALLCMEVHAQMTFRPLGALPGRSFNSLAYGISADGSVVVGQSASASCFEAFRWTSGDGIVGLGDLPACSTISEPSPCGVTMPLTLRPSRAITGLKSRPTGAGHS